VPRNPRLVDVAPTIFELALENLGLPSKEVAMVGDDPELDVGGAQAAGLRGILVETGRYHPGAESPFRPDLVLESVAQSPEALDIQGSSGTVECGFLLANALAA
jgi:ribonucleotide monophosphatase NagD (HAD superfamily)